MNLELEISVSILNSISRVDDINKLNDIEDVSYIHYDVMDNIFVRNKQFEIDELDKLFKICKKKKDIHLMVSNPKEYIEFLGNLDVEYITIHIEIDNLDNYIKLIKGYNKKVGLAINPDTDIKKILPYLSIVDLILVLSVVPGHGGQSFIPSTIDKILYLNDVIKKNKNDIKIEVDGGVNDTNKDILRKCNVDIIVVGSFITKSDDFVRQIDMLK